MKRFFFSILVLFAVKSFSQPKLGEVACVYVTSTNLDSSVAVYEKLGFKKIIVSKYHQKGFSKPNLNIEVITMGRVDEVYRFLF